MSYILAVIVAVVVWLAFFRAYAARGPVVQVIEATVMTAVMCLLLFFAYCIYLSHKP